MSPDHLSKYTNPNIFRKRFVKGFVRDVIELYRKTNGKSILDIGCAEGYVLNQIHENFPDVRCEGLDISEESLACGRKHFPGLSLRQGDLLDPETEGGSYDVITCTEMLEHTPDTASALASLRRRCRGYLITSVPNEPWFRIANFVSGRHMMRLGNTPGHVNNWSRAKFSGLLVDAGFEIVDRRMPFPWQMYLVR